ncbi:multiprotein-bridging factor 1 family protein [Micromonospora sp. NPDC051006]|uniref:multiprotein-bridging factor 1 family protein n=1 Tax=Micromonospora sp. NPDC051006 TaxID=3364283 RepID=UPI0037A7BCFA
MASALDPVPTGPTVGPFPISGLVRRARRITGLGQRQMARFAKVAPSTVGKVEAGTMTPSLAVLERLLGAAGLYLAVVDQDGRVIQPMADWEGIRDGVGRRYPSHLNTILDPEPGEWWAGIYGLARPPETFHRCQYDREVRRRRSQWEVRVAKYRNVPPPPDPRGYD